MPRPAELRHLPRDLCGQWFCDAWLARREVWLRPIFVCRYRGSLQGRMNKKNAYVSRISCLTVSPSVGAWNTDCADAYAFRPFSLGERSTLASRRRGLGYKLGCG